MLTDKLKKAVIYGAITLATSNPVIDNIPPAPRVMKHPDVTIASTVKQEQQKKVSSRKRDPFRAPKNINYLAIQYNRIIKSFDSLSSRLEKDGFDKEKIQKAFKDARFKIHPEIYYYFLYNPEAKTETYAEYREKIGLPKKIKDAPGFFIKHLDSFLGAEARYGVEACVTAAVLGVESDFGNNLGDFGAFNAAVSLYSTPKKGYAYTQLKALLSISDRWNVDFMDVLSSYALCSFPGQFQLTNISMLFVGKNPESKGNLLDMDDWIYSIAHFLEKAGWNSKQNYKPIIEGSRNHKAIWIYNNSEFYRMSVKELTYSLRKNPELQAARKKYLEERVLVKPDSNN
jgi:membrane-bound lytic murein transglycosylase B